MESGRSRLQGQGSAFNQAAKEVYWRLWPVCAFLACPLMTLETLPQPAVILTALAPALAPAFPLLGCGSRLEKERTWGSLLPLFFSLHLLFLIAQAGFAIYQRMTLNF